MLAVWLVRNPHYLGPALTRTSLLSFAWRSIHSSSPMQQSVFQNWNVPLNMLPIEGSLPSIVYTLERVITLVQLSLPKPEYPSISGLRLVKVPRNICSLGH